MSKEVLKELEIGSSLLLDYNEDTTRKDRYENRTEIKFRKGIVKPVFRPGELTKDQAIINSLTRGERKKYIRRVERQYRLKFGKNNKYPLFRDSPGSKENFVEYLENEAGKYATYKSYIKMIRTVCSSIPFDKITTKWGYKMERGFIKKGYAPTTVYSIMHTIVIALDRATKEGKLTINPLHKYKCEINPHPKRRAFDEEDIKVLEELLEEYRSTEKKLTQAKQGKYDLLCTHQNAMRATHLIRELYGDLERRDVVKKLLLVAETGIRMKDLFHITSKNVVGNTLIYKTTRRGKKELCGGTTLPTFLIRVSLSDKAMRLIETEGALDTSFVKTRENCIYHLAKIFSKAGFNKKYGKYIGFGMPVNYFLNNFPHRERKERIESTKEEPRRIDRKRVAV